MNCQTNADCYLYGPGGGYCSANQCIYYNNPPVVSGSTSPRANTISTQSASTQNVAKSSGFNWWWLVLIIVILLLLWWILSKRNQPTPILTTNL